MARSPKSGCLIAVVALLVFTLVACWTVYTGYTQNKAIDKFTQDEPGDLQVKYRDEDTVFELRARVRSFGEAAQNGEKATLSLTPEDLNDLIGHEDKLIDLREIVAFHEITDLLKGRIVFPMQQLPFFGTKLRYLSAEADFAPQIQKGQLLLRIVAIRPDSGAVIPEGFVDSISGNMNLLGAYKEDKVLRPIYKRLTSLEITDGSLVVKAN